MSGLSSQAGCTCARGGGPATRREEAPSMHSFAMMVPSGPWACSKTKATLRHMWLVIAPQHWKGEQEAKAPPQSVESPKPAQASLGLLLPLAPWPLPVFPPRHISVTFLTLSSLCLLPSLYFRWVSHFNKLEHLHHFKGPDSPTLFQWLKCPPSSWSGLVHGCAPQGPSAAWAKQSTQLQ